MLDGVNYLQIQPNVGEMNFCKKGASAMSVVNEDWFMLLIASMKQIVSWDL